jgi:predicted nucleotide-binding protein
MAKKRSEPEYVKLSSQQMRDAIPKLRRRIEELKALDPTNLKRRGDPRFEAIENKANNTLGEIFGVGAVQYNENHVMLDTASIYMGNETPRDEVVEGYKIGIESAVAHFQALVDYFEEELKERIGIEGGDAREGHTKGNGNKIFIVHGHDQAALQEVARFVEKLGLEAVVLHEKANEGQTIIEKFEKHAREAHFAVVLLTPDDVGYPSGKAEAAERRARQNVILELGWFAGKLGRGRVVALNKGVEIPSDLHGVLYERMDAEGAWRLRVAMEMRTAGIKVDLNKL